ncbi:hypothetical protein [Euryhalocaulis caribicus]|uniref:hypothetical protein n=1 Tax=Euryhalocaulis caribicus TaxID=1161401 RepID=UPI001378E35A|nr:hypothetical protein [Euryhalocaulis caribicus]
MSTLPNPLNPPSNAEVNEARLAWERAPKGQRERRRREYQNTVNRQLAAEMGRAWT